MDDAKKQEVGRRALEILAEAQLAPGREQDAVGTLVGLGPGTSVVLIDALDLLDGRGRRIAALALAELEEPEGWEALERLLRESGIELRGELPSLLRGLGRMCPPAEHARCLAVLGAHAGSPDPLVRAAVADALFPFPSALSTPLLRRLRADSDPFVRDRAQAALVGGGEDATLPGPGASRTGGSSRTCGGAIPDEVRELLHRLTSPDEEERRRARSDFARHPERLRVLQAWGTGPALPLRRALLEALTEHPAPDCRDFIAAALDRMDLAVEDRVLLLRAAAFQKMQHPAFTTEQARRYLQHPDLFLRAELAGLLATCTGAPLDALPRLLRDREFHVRERAARAWHANADRSRERIVPDVLDLVEEVFAQPALHREDVILLTVLLAGLVRILRDGGFVEERFARIAARALSGDIPPLRRQGAALLRAIGREDVTRIDPAAYAPVPHLLLSESEEDAELAIELLERATPPSIDRNIDAITRYVYRADTAPLVRIVALLANAGSARSRDLLQRLTRHPTEEVARAAAQALQPPRENT